MADTNPDAPNVKIVPQRHFVAQAEKFYNEQKYYNCLVECRKTIYVGIESGYVIDAFVDGDNSLFSAALCKAPQHTKNKQYIDEYVRDPFDYVQLDHGRVDAELLRDGIEPRYSGISGV